eukprot:1015325-Rhodomonas_salina.1
MANRGADRAAEDKLKAMEQTAAVRESRQRENAEEAEMARQKVALSRCGFGAHTRVAERCVCCLQCPVFCSECECVSAGARVVCSGLFSEASVP